MRLPRATIMKRFEMVFFYHQGFTVLFEKEADLCRCRRIAEQERIFHYLIEIEEFH
jgi:hypothetical protein